jgi:hypothetical protein
VDVNGIEVKDKTAEADLIFLLDYNDDHNNDISFGSKETLNNKTKSLQKLKENDANKLEAMIYIETIGRERMLCVTCPFGVVGRTQRPLSKVFFSLFLSDPVTFLQERVV